MSPVLLAVMGLGGYVVYNEVSKSGSHASNAGQPGQTAKQPFWSSWGNAGSSPQTGNGAPTTDVQGVTGAISDVAKFGTSLVSFFGTSSTNGTGGSGNGLGTQTTSWGDGDNGGDSGGFNF